MNNGIFSNEFNEYMKRQAALINSISEPVRNYQQEIERAIEPVIRQKEAIRQSMKPMKEQQEVIRKLIPPYVNSIRTISRISKSLTNVMSSQDLSRILASINDSTLAIGINSLDETLEETSTTSLDDWAESYTNDNSEVVFDFKVEKVTDKDVLEGETSLNELDSDELSEGIDISKQKNIIAFLMALVLFPSLFMFANGDMSLEIILQIIQIIVNLITWVL